MKAMEINSIEKTDVLQSLSEEHHNGRTLSWNIQQGLRQSAPIEKIWSYVDWFWENNLSTHFELEETHLFSIIPSDNKHIKKALSQHRRLRRLFEKSPKDIRSLNSIEEELNRLIRFEESILFGEVAKYATEEQLLAINDLIDSSSQKEWQGDQFWKTKQA